MIYLLLGLSYLAASSLVLSVVLAYQEQELLPHESIEGEAPPPSTRHHLLATSVSTQHLPKLAQGVILVSPPPPTTIPLPQIFSS